MNKQIDYNLLPSLAAKANTHWKRYYAKNKKKLEGMDVQIQAIHDKVSKRTNCLLCANCCKTLGPRITDKDVDRMAKALKLKAADVINKFLKIDEDGDLVFKEMPCPFLGHDNYCAIYEWRPKACKEYPHTDRKKFFQLFNLSIVNASTCPIVYDVLQIITKENEQVSTKKSK